jgi:hypothetical protein
MYVPPGERGSRNQTRVALAGDAVDGINFRMQVIRKRNYRKQKSQKTDECDNFKVRAAAGISPRHNPAESP